MALSRSGVRAPYPPLLSAAFLPLGWRVLCILVCTSAFSSVACASEPNKPGQESEQKRFAEVRIGEDEALRLIKSIRQNTPTKEEAAVWARVANSDKYSNVRRRRATLQLFDRNVSQGMTLGELARLLAKPSWLKRENTLEVVGPARAYVPIRSVHGESVFCLSVGLPPTDWSGVYVRIKDPLAGDPLTRDLLYDTLQGKQTNATELKRSSKNNFVI